MSRPDRFFASKAPSKGSFGLAQGSKGRLRMGFNTMLVFSNSGQLHSGEEIYREFVATCGDGAKVLEQIEKRPTRLRSQ